MAEPESSERLVEVLKEIRDELHAVRIELGTRTGGRMTSGIRTRVMNRGRWQSAALAAGGVAALVLVIGLARRDPRAPQPATVVVPPQVSAVTPAMPPQAVISPAPAPVAVPAPVVAHAAVPVTRSPVVPAPANKAEAAPGGPPLSKTMAAVPAPAKKRLRSDVAARGPEVVSDDEETMAFPPSPKRVRVHRLSYGPVGSEPAKL